MRTLSRFPAARASLAAAVLSLTPSLSGCGSGFLSTKREGDVTVSYAADAEQNYLLGKKHLDDKSFPEALKYFEFVSARFPYSQYAALSDLGIADTQYASERYIEAAERYRNFLKLHPTHPKVDYAAFQVGMSYVNQIPSDFFILPRATEKDQTDVKNALALFNEFLAGYPNSALQPKAKAQVLDLRRKLAEHEIRVARFYREHERAKSAAGRYETVARDYSKLGYDGEALIELGHIYIELKQPEKAKPFLEKLIKDFPDDSHVGEAKKLLART